MDAGGAFGVGGEHSGEVAGGSEHEVEIGGHGPGIGSR